jgi:hypothetical protein
MIHSRFNKVLAAVILAVAATGCATSSQEQVEYWKAQQEKYKTIAAVEASKAAAESVRYIAAAKAADNADAGGKSAIGVTLASSKPSAEGSNASKSIMFAADAKPESTEDKVFKWSNLVLGILVPEMRRDRDSKRQAEVASKQAEYDYLTQRDTANAFVEMGRTIKPTYNNSFNGPGAEAPAAE